ncbi:MAG: hypothetical protein K2L72_01225, partial [Clostridia bacterium]|nr:hypothetical protein [Clostridia bacterium]
NPSIELTLDKNDKVISVYGANEDGQVLLYKEDGIIGVDVETAVGKITSLAVEYGYLDEGNKVVETSVTSAKGSSEELLEKVNAKVTATADSLNLSVTCDGEGAYSLLRKLEQIKAKYPDNAAIQSLTPEKLKLVLTASEDGSISVEAAAELDTSELLNKVSQAHKKVEEYATAAYGKIKAEASAAYDVAVGDVCDGIYTTYYTLHHPLNAYYGFSYQSYKYSARALNAVADALVYAEKTCEYPLNEAQVAAAAEALGLGANVDALKNSDGEITVNSIYAYADKTFKNSDAAAEIEQIKTDLNAALDTVEEQLQTKVDEASKKYETQINTVKEQLNSAANSINSLLALIPESVKTQVQTMVNDCRELATEAVKIAEDGKITADEVRGLAAKFEEKSAATLKKIESDLTKEELEEVRKLQSEAESRLTAAKKKMEEAIAQAEKEAKAKLDELKAKRTNK